MTALVTGASSGIGLTFARELARQGHDVLLVSNQEAELAQAAANIEHDFHVSATALYKDLTSPTAAQEIYDFCSERHIETDILINNAGVFFFNYLHRVPMEQIEQILLLHVLNTTRLTRLFGKDMQQRRRGYILNMSSLAGFVSLPSIQCYCATKAYIDNFSRSVWYELHPYGVNVLSVTPGAVDTGLYGLSLPLRKLALKLHVSITPERLVRKALKALFRGRKRCMPGLLNHLYLPFVKHCPDRLIFKTLKRIDRYMK